MKRVIRLRETCCLELDGNKPKLNKTNADKVIKALIIYYGDYMNYDNSNNPNEYVYYYRLFKDALKFGKEDSTIKNICSNSGYVSQYKDKYKDMGLIFDLIRKTNALESTRTSIKCVEKLSRIINDLSKREFLLLIKNEDRKYSIIEKLLNNNVEKCLSLISKLCFHFANSIFKSDCGFSKYDRIVSINLSKYCECEPNKFDKKDYKTYINYCNTIGFLCKLGLSRNDIDQIIWLYYKNKM